MTTNTNARGGIVTVTITVSARPADGKLPILQAVSSSVGGKDSPSKDPHGYGVQMTGAGQIVFKLVNLDTTTNWIFQEWMGLQPYVPNLFGITFIQWNADINKAIRNSPSQVTIFDVCKQPRAAKYIVNLFNGDESNPIYLPLNDPTIKDQPR